MLSYIEGIIKCFNIFEEVAHINNKCPHYKSQYCYESFFRVFHVDNTTLLFLSFLPLILA